jgi:hypothetical protein
MKEFITFPPEVMAIVAVSLAAIFIVLLTTMLKILKAVSFFQGVQVWVMAVSVSLLCILGMVIPSGTYKSVGGDNEIKITANYLLLGYMALAVAVGVILSQLLLLAGRILPGERTKVDDRGWERPPTAKANSPGRPKKEEADLPLAKPKPHGRPKKEKLAEEQPKEDGSGTAGKNLEPAE